MAHQLDSTLWLITLLRRYQRLTFAQISDYWQKSLQLSGGDPLPRSSFNRLRDSAADRFRIYIGCDRRTNTYYIDLSEDSEVTEWLLSSFSFSALQHQTQHVRQRILLTAPPQGMQYFDLVVEAFRAECCLQATYHKFGAEPYQCHLRPYLLKTYEGRWYLLAQKNDEPTVKTFALDRFEWMQLIPTEHFSTPADFDPAEFYAYTFGIYHRDGIPPIITLRVRGKARNYLRLSPLHDTQREEPVDADTSLFHLTCHTTPDLLLAILRQGHLVEVVAPADFRQLVADEVRQMAACYEL